MKKFWWSVFIGALFGILLLFPETSFSYRVFNLAHTLQLSVVQIIGLLALNTSILGGIFGALWGTIAQPYLSERVKNLATKHDVSEITRKVEEVKHQYQKMAEDHKHKNQLRMAALDQRLQAHQGAFEYISRLLQNQMTLKEDILSSNDSEKSIYGDFIEWLNRNSLYLDAGVRKDIYGLKFYVAGSILKEEVDIGELSNFLLRILRALEEATDLPPIAGEAEKEQFFKLH